ncbi:type II secretion system protein F [Gammaproteobacteria bacterium 54_18_T64]|nr:type II secretion system protein F [Gammaproteobacteria bacterium 54_18_T64]
MATVSPTAQIYVYKGKSKDGRQIKGEMRGSNPSLVKAQLRQQGIIAKSVRKKPKDLFGSGKPIKPGDIATFSRQMATMMKAGVPLVQSFEIVSDGAENPNMKKLIDDLHADVAAGNSFAFALRKFPQHFDNLFCSLIEAGENSGSLDTLLDRVATYKEKSEQLKRKIKKAMTYPIAVIIVAIIVTAILLIKVVPVFADVFTGFGADLPAFTLFVVGLSDFAQKWWFVILATLIAIGYAFKTARLRSPKFSDAVDKAMLKLPAVGPILNNAVIARYARTLATTFAAGVPLVEALGSVAGASGNAVYRDAILQVQADVTTGLTIHTALKATDLFPVMLLQLTSIGEESGSLDEMMEKAADHYEEAVDNAVDNLTALLEPMIMAVLGVLVGGLLIAMYLPIFQLGNVVG